MAARKIIIDTDIGDDIDDAFAIALASSMPEVELIGITTVFRNVAQRAQLAEKLLQTAGVQVPVYAGEAIPYCEPFHVFEKDTHQPPEQAPLCQWDESYAHLPVRSGGVDFLIECAKKYGKELTVVPIGPMTNIARAIQKDPEAMKGIGAIVTMGGSFAEYRAEWNILCDPEAADTVYSSGIPLYAVGLDVTLQCGLEADLLEKFRTSEQPLNELLSLWLSRWFAFFRFEKSVMHDPLAVASLLGDICKFEEKYVKVDLTDTRGAIFVSDDPKPSYTPVYVATQVDREAFYSVIRARLLEEKGPIGQKSEKI